MPKFVVKSEEEPNLCCFSCDVEIIRDSEEHDICHITEDGELCCQECLDNCDCECCEEKESWCYENSTKDTIESDRCYCSVGNCALPTFIEEEEKKKRFNEIVSPEHRQKLQSLTRDELYEFINLTHHQ